MNSKILISIFLVLTIILYGCAEQAIVTPNAEKITEKGNEKVVFD